MPHLNASVATLVSENFSLLQELDMQFGVLDLASGRGRNGLFLVEHHIPVIFADNNEAALTMVSDALIQLGDRGQKCSTWLVDFEADNSKPLLDKCFDAILVFNYLHRPLIGAIQDAVVPGGLLFYETFTEAQSQYGRPNNPNFLLKENELREAFSHWDILHYFEGDMPSGPETIKAAASLIARKPKH